MKHWVSHTHDKAGLYFGNWTSAMNYGRFVFKCRSFTNLRITMFTFYRYINLLSLKQWLFSIFPWKNKYLQVLEILLRITLSTESFISQLTITIGTHGQWGIPYVINQSSFENCSRNQSVVLIHFIQYTDILTTWQTTDHSLKAVSVTSACRLF